MRDPRAHGARTSAQSQNRSDRQSFQGSVRARLLRMLVGVTASTEHDRLQPSPAAKASISADGLVILDMSGGLVLSSNDVGARIWELLEQRHARGEIARRLANEYEIPIDRAQRDVAAFVAALIARGLVTPETRP
jgi:hypothetical protein